MANVDGVKFASDTKHPLRPPDPFGRALSYRLNVPETRLGFGGRLFDIVVDGIPDVSGILLGRAFFLLYGWCLLATRLLAKVDCGVSAALLDLVCRVLVRIVVVAVCHESPDSLRASSGFERPA